MPSYAPWTCDSCGLPIESVKDGWVEWLTRGSSSESEWPASSCRELRLVHHKTASPRARDPKACYHDEDKWFAIDRTTVSDLPLERFMGQDGLLILLGFLSDRQFSDTEEVLEMIKRIHIEGYEQARGNFDAAISDGAFEPNTKPRYYKQEDIQATLRWIDERRDY